MRRVVLVELILFAVTAALVVPFGIAYVAGPRAFGDPIRVHAEMVDAFGLTAGTSVTYRGVQVGRVASVSLAGNGSGARVEVELDPGTRIPRASAATVTMGTVAGLQNVDLVPDPGAGGPYLGDGDEVAAPAERQPVQMGEVLGETARLLAGVDPAAVATVGDEVGAALAGVGPDLARMIDDGDRLSGVVARQTPTVRSLLERTVSVAGSAAGAAGAFERTASAARTVSGQLGDASELLEHLVGRSPAALSRTRELFDGEAGTFGALLADLAWVTPVVADRRAAVAAGLVDIPVGLGKLESIVRGDRAEFALVGTQGPVCGYDTPRRTVGDTGPVTPDLTLFCPPGPDVAQRGSRTAPRPNGLGTEQATTPGTVIGPPMVPDPVLIPTGVEALDQWHRLLDDLEHSGR
ncbi:MlaD family protein [Prescottella subtropica]|uniref:MlaD family protein n=1 Tax=Prescottella subtropica TaxID=2545757 RepID=UPI0010F65544|nr:MCE family protein [Prescottella subtropica]